MLATKIGQCVAAAREQVGWTLHALAERTALDAQQLGAIERGELLASTAKLDRIARALGLDAFALYAGEGVALGLAVLPRSASGGDLRTEDLAVLRDALERAEALRSVSSLLGLAPEPPEAPRAPSLEDPAADGYFLAQRVRKALGNVAQPLDALEAAAAEKLCVPVLAAPLATRSLFAATARRPHRGAAAIVLNTQAEGAPAAASRQAQLVARVHVAHELCHALFDEATDSDGALLVLERALRPGDEHPAVERRAHAFAAELLIPSLGLRAHFGDARQLDTPSRAEELIDAARAHFRTPAELAVNHLYNRGYLARDEAFRRDLVERAQQRPLDFDVAPLDVERWRAVLAARTQRAHEESLLSDGAARALLEVPPGAPLPWDLERRPR